MTRITALFSAAAALALVACSQQDADAAAKTAKVNDGVDAAVVQTSGPAAPAGYAVRPGYWKTVTDSGDGEPEETFDCITPEEARIEKMRTVTGGLKQDGCNYTKSHFDGGRIEMVGSCNNGGVSGSTSMKGSYGADRIDYVLDMTMVMSPGAEPISLKSKVKSRRVADACPAEDS